MLLVSFLLLFCVGQLIEEHSDIKVSTVEMLKYFASRWISGHGGNEMLDYV